MNPRRAMADFVAQVRALFGKLHGRTHKASGARSLVRSSWRTVLTMDLADVLEKIKGHVGGQSNLGAIRMNNPESWPGWFRSGFLALVLLAALGLIAIPVWSESLIELHQKQAESQERMARYKHLAGEAALLEQYRDRVAALDASFGTLLEMIPAELEMVQILNQFSQVARASGVRLELFKPEMEVHEDAYAILPVHMRLSGSFNGIVRFLESISGMQHLVTVDVLIEPNESIPGSNLLIARIRAYRGESTQPQRAAAAPGRASDVGRQ